MTPPRPAAVWARARWFDRCRTCDRIVWPLQAVGRWGGQWQHAECVQAQGAVWVRMGGDPLDGF